jgi:hypothetical protein
MAFSISIGEMRSSGTFRKNTPVANTSGGFSDNYTDVLSCRGRFRQHRGNKSIEQGDVVQNKGYEWVCRFQQGIVIDVDSVWVIKGQSYRVTNWEKVDEINHWYVFTLSVFQ